MPVQGLSREREQPCFRAYPVPTGEISPCARTTQDRPMFSTENIREHAETLLQRSRGCFDLGTATRLRLTAEDLMAKADELEDRDRRNASVRAFLAK